jgi:ATP-dependent DNA helicase RecG
VSDRTAGAATEAWAGLTAPVGTLRGVGDKRSRELARAGVHTVGDLLLRLPFRYEDRTSVVPISGLRPGVACSVMGDVARCASRRTARPGFTVVEVLLRDQTGLLPVVWFNQRFLRDVFTPGRHVVLYGPIETRGLSGLQMTNPSFEFVEAAGTGEALHVGRIVPIYERLGVVTAKVQRALVHQALSGVEFGPEPLPSELRERLGLPPRDEALREVHFPAAGADVTALNARCAPAQRRLVFEEFFAFQLGVALRRLAARAERKVFQIGVTDGVRAAARALLPFKLTAGQREAVREIVEDMQRPRPMNRLLQGDVGAGKTIVAALAGLVALENGLQVAVMAPTGILAEQHLRTFSRLFEATRYPVRLLTAATSARERRETLAALRRVEPVLVIGTHALVEAPVEFGALALVVVDEQHRFGVVHRAALRAKGQAPDVLVMTATPIPRTLAMTTYGDLDVSVIKGRLPGRVAVRTVAKPEERRDAVYAFVRGELDAGRQAYVVYPLVEQSEKVDLRAATAMADHLAGAVFPQHRVALLHGRLPAEAKDRVMRAFAGGEIQVLVSTTVIEVGVDVPNASVMVVEHAENFGLAQLHQLRGRVGRGSAAASCVLLYQSPLTPEARARLEALVAIDDGFVIAERDLELRGPGDVFGTRQAGMPHLRVGDLIRDRAVMEQARTEARAWVDTHGADDSYVREVAASWSTRFGLGEIA